MADLSQMLPSLLQMAMQQNMRDQEWEREKPYKDAQLAKWNADTALEQGKLANIQKGFEAAGQFYDNQASPLNEDLALINDTQQVPGAGLLATEDPNDIATSAANIRQELKRLTENARMARQGGFKQFQEWFGNDVTARLAGHGMPKIEGGYQIDPDGSVKELPKTMEASGSIYSGTSQRMNRVPGAPEPKTSFDQLKANVVQSALNKEPNSVLTYDEAVGMLTGRINDATSQKLAAIEKLAGTWEGSIKDNTPISESLYSQYASFNPSDRDRLREQFLRNRVRTRTDSPDMREELGNILTKRELDFSQFEEIKTENADGSSSVSVFRKQDMGKPNKKPVAVFKGSPRNITEAMQTKVEESYINSNVLLKNLGVVEHATKPEYLTYVGRTKEAILNSLTKANWTDKDAKAYIEEFESWRGSVNRTFNTYRRLVTGMQAAEKELERIEKDFLSGKMSHPQFQAAMKTISEEARTNQDIYMEAKTKGLTPYGRGSAGGQGSEALQNFLQKSGLLDGN